VVADRGGRLHVAAQRHLSNQLHVPSQIEGARVDYGPDSIFPYGAHGGDGLFAEAVTVDDLRAGVAEAGGVGANVLVAQGEAQVVGIHGPHHAVHGCHCHPSRPGANAGILLRIPLGRYERRVSCGQACAAIAVSVARPCICHCDLLGNRWPVYIDRKALGGKHANAHFDP
jgi:hypothetical protein